MTPFPPSEQEERQKLASQIEEYSMALWDKTYEDWVENQGYSDENPPPTELMREHAKSLGEYYEAHNEQMYSHSWEEEEDTGEKYKVKNLWKKAYNLSVHEQPIFCEMDYYKFIGGWFKRNYILINSNEEDLRIHETKIADSGTGKTESNNFFAEVVKEAGLTINFLNRFNDASIIGSYDKEISARNKKKGRSPEDPDYEDPIIYGVLHNYDFVEVDEAERILKPTTNSEQVQITFQTAMNRMGSAGNKVSNNLVNGEVAYHPECSIGLCSYYLEEIKETLVTKGLIQRMIFYNQEPNIDLRRKIERKIMDSADSSETAIQTNTQKELIKEFLHQLKSVSKPPCRIRMSKQVRDKILFYNEEMRLAAEYSPKGQQAIFNSILSRGLIKMMKISALNALSEGRSYVTLNDVEEMYPLIKASNISIFNFISDNVETRIDIQQETWLQDMRERLGKREILKTVAKQIMMEKWRREKRTAEDRMKKLSNYFNIIDRDGKKYIQMK